MLAMLVAIESALLQIPHRLSQRAQSDERGQAAAEYALVLLGAAGVALLFIAWANKSNRVGRLLDTVFDQLLKKAK